MAVVRDQELVCVIKFRLRPNWPRHKTFVAESVVAVVFSHPFLYIHISLCLYLHLSQHSDPPGPHNLP